MYDRPLISAFTAARHRHLKKTWEKVNLLVVLLVSCAEHSLALSWVSSWPICVICGDGNGLIVYNRIGHAVHGSLARAGKVKSQTPKVEKQEKKKTPKGRAKKRILYNRRFVNVTTLPGGKRRMNPNPEK
ncbi:hypothetical protein OBBRIDRAFT_823383 [Obba rivulosa]|uniref:40S ribosomal protein S30 n=1 Tax=Obba rivulosa TaxID=1052685 RepID=A0A8E2DRW2_9APHY|nr:hypothetical protein OBBRIDRAFT_823383 [Obba rivulosa]